MPFKVIKENILRANDGVASGIRSQMKEDNALMINIISSPGSGKTTLLERSGGLFKENNIKFCVLTGDCFTSNDARRIDQAGIEAVQINTGNSCHIDASLVKKALCEINAKPLDLVVVENVGNLVCPAEFDIGEDLKIALLSVAEGHDKPEKYPLLFAESELVLINKLDLIEHTDFDLAECDKIIKRISPNAKILHISCKNGDGIEQFIEWIKNRIKTKKER